MTAAQSLDESTENNGGHINVLWVNEHEDCAYTDSSLTLSVRAWDIYRCLNAKAQGRREGAEY